MLGGEQAHAAQDERAHHDLGELGVGLHQIAQPLGVDGEHRAAVARADASEPGDAAQRGELAGEVTRLEQRDPFLAVLHFEAAVEHHEQALLALARLDQHLAGAGRDARAERFQALDLRRRELRKHLLAALLVDRVHLRSAASTASKSFCMPNETSWITPLTKNPGVPRTPLASPLSMCSRTRCR